METEDQKAKYKDVVEKFGPIDVFVLPDLNVALRNIVMSNAHTKMMTKSGCLTATLIATGNWEV